MCSKVWQAALRNGISTFRKLRSRRYGGVSSTPKRSALWSTRGVALALGAASIFYTSRHLALTSQLSQPEESEEPNRNPFKKKSELSLEILFDPVSKLDFSGRPPTILGWSKKHLESYLEQKHINGRTQLVRVNAYSGEYEVVIDALPAFTKLEGEELAKKIVSELLPKSLNAQEDRALYDLDGALFYYNSRTDTAMRVTPSGCPRADCPRMSPDGKKVSYVKENDLYVFDLLTSELTRLTHTGSATTFNGKLDWVYQEEIFGRGNFHSHWWSPDSTHIAFLELEDREIPECHGVVDNSQVHAMCEITRYPQPGDPNPTVRLGVCNLAQTTKITSRENEKREVNPTALSTTDDNNKKTTTISTENKEATSNKQTIDKNQQLIADTLPLPTTTTTATTAAKEAESVREVNPTFLHIAPKDTLICRVKWLPDSTGVLFQTQNRQQTYLDLNCANVESGKISTLFREETGAWVDVHGNPKFLIDGSFLWQRTTRAGSPSLLHYSREGECYGQVLEGLHFTKLHGVKSNQIFFSGCVNGRNLEQHLYKLDLTNGKLETLTKYAGTHDVKLNSKCNLFVDSYSDVLHPTRTAIFRTHSPQQQQQQQLPLQQQSNEQANDEQQQQQLVSTQKSGVGVKEANIEEVEEGEDERLVRVVDKGTFHANHAQFLSDVRSPEFLQVKTRDGVDLEAMMILPKDMEEGKKYPVIYYQYSGPGTPLVKNRWGGLNYLWHQMMANKGYIIWVCDVRTASGKPETAFAGYRKFGEMEMRDTEDAVAHLSSLEFVDNKRLGIWGWSFGGYMTAYALTHSSLFKCGIAGAPVTDWTLYDTIYTERYMDTPQNNKEGYEKSSVTRTAHDLNGKLLLIHGTMDDNVHIQNSIQFIHELQKNNIPFEYMCYPNSRHGVDSPLVPHYRALMTDFFSRSL